MILKTQYNTLEKFRFAVKNTVVSERGPLPFLYAGPFPTRVLWNVTPLFKDCSTSESVYPVTDYLDLKIPKHGTAYTPIHGKESLGLGAAGLWTGCSGPGSAGSVEGSVPI